MKKSKVVTMRKISEKKKLKAKSKKTQKPLEQPVSAKNLVENLNNGGEVKEVKLADSVQELLAKSPIKMGDINHKKDMAYLERNYQVEDSKPKKEVNLFDTIMGDAKEKLKDQEVIKSLNMGDYPSPNRDLKEAKKAYKMVKAEFKGRGLSKKKMKAIANGIVLNGTLMEMDAKQHEQYLEDYYNKLFTKFKEFIIEHNKAVSFDADNLKNKIADYNRELPRLELKVLKLRKQVKSLRIEKGIFENA